MDNLYSKNNLNTEKTIQVPFSILLTTSEKEQIESNLYTVKYKKKDIIFRQNTRTSHVMFIKSGLVKIFKEGRNDRYIILKVAKEGDFIGLMSVFGEKVHQYSASAATDCEVCDIDISIFKNVLMSNGKFALQFLNILSIDGLFIFERLLGQSHKQLPGRIAEVILYFSEQIYHNTEFSFPFTRKELADIAGTTKESFIRTLAEFKNDKIIEINGPRIKIISMDIIKTLSNLG